jgi:uncharacterized membrane protein YcaP (DUF421 family)
MEIVIRAVFMFVFMWVVTRVVGRATLGELSSFQLLLFITMGDLVQQAITQQDSSVTSGVLAISVFALLTIAVAWVNARSPRLRPVTHGVPVVVIRSGELLGEVLVRERMSANDLMAAAREQGIRRLTEVDLGVLDADGKVSFFAVPSAQDGGSQEPSRS